VAHNPKRDRARYVLGEFITALHAGRQFAGTYDEVAGPTTKAEQRAVEEKWFAYERQSDTHDYFGRENK
jgi:hypothetical protein